MKTTLEIPDAIFRRAKASAASRNISLREFVTQAISDKLRTELSPADRRRWLEEITRPLIPLRAETARIAQLIEEEFETIDPEDWE